MHILKRCRTLTTAAQVLLARAAAALAAPSREVFPGALGLLTVACATTSWPGGIQARLLWSEEGGVRVLSTAEGGPAARAGLAPGDRLIAVDGVPIGGLDARQVHELLRGEVGSQVELTVERDGQWQTLRMERAPYHTGTGGAP